MADSDRRKGGRGRGTEMRMAPIADLACAPLSSRAARSLGEASRGVPVQIGLPEAARRWPPHARHKDQTSPSAVCSSQARALAQLGIQCIPYYVFIPYHVCMYAHPHVFMTYLLFGDFAFSAFIFEFSFCSWGRQGMGHGRQRPEDGRQEGQGCDGENCQTGR